MQSPSKTGGLVILFLSVSMLLVFTIPAIASSFISQEEAPLSTNHDLFLPVVQNFVPSVSLTDSWTSDPDDVTQVAFLTNGQMVHQISGNTESTITLSATLEITWSGPCDNGLVYSTSLNLSAGAFTHSAQLSAPGCQGLFTATTKISHAYGSDSMDTQFISNTPVSPTYTNLQGFDRCTHPTVEEMQAWWDNSPYDVFNLYIGGIHYPSGCQTPPIDAFWVNEVAQQGWTFTTVWVGPQAPCTSFKYRMHSNPTNSYQQGKEEAIAAAAAARSLGFFGEITIHYDVEGYSFSPTYTDACKLAVRSFIQGWTDQLHLLGLKAGAYGGSCSSKVADWANNSPVLDQVWIAYWQLPAEYNPNATVWNAPCLDNRLWAAQKRLRQYAGDHSETHGGVELGIDSNVFDTKVLSITQTSPANVLGPAHIQDFSLVDSSAGWVLSGYRLLWTSDLGQTWSDRTPADFVSMAASFLNPSLGWVAGYSSGEKGLQIGITIDGGLSWQLSTVDPAGGLDNVPVAATYLALLDSNTLWLSVKLQSGSAFSLGMLYASADGGRSWTQRTIPIGEPVHFISPAEGWTSGGPGNNEIYRTLDGGRSWEAVEVYPPGLDAVDSNLLSNLPGSIVDYSVVEGHTAWVLALEGSCSGEKGAMTCMQQQALLLTTDGGSNWVILKIPQVE